MGNWWPLGVNQGLYFNPGPTTSAYFKRLNDNPLHKTYPYNDVYNKIDKEYFSNAISNCNDSVLFYSLFDSLITWKHKNFTTKNYYYTPPATGYYTQPAFSPAIIIPIPKKSNTFLHIRTLYVGHGERPNQVFAHIASQIYANRNTNQVHLVSGKERVRLPIDSIFSTSAFTADELFRLNLTWTPHSDGVNLWVLDLFNDSTLHAFLVDSNGINVIPVTSFIRGNVSLGNIRTSHDGRTLAVSGVRPAQSKIYSTWLYDFDASTGKATNGRGILKHSDHGKSLSKYLEFSAKDSFLYVATHVDTLIFGNRLFQHNLYTKKNILIDVLPNQSVQNSWRFSGLQLAPDNRIYAGYVNWWHFGVNNFSGNYISCIQYPEREGTACRFKRDSIFFKYSIGWGLPNPYHYPMVLDAYIHPQHSCEDTSTIRIDAKWFNQLKINWGDGDSVIYNKREWLAIPDQKHYYKKNGKYLIRLSGYMPPCNNFYSWQDTITIMKNPISEGYTLTENTLCGRYQITLTDKTKNAYKIKVNWGNGVDSTYNPNINLTHYYDTSGRFLMTYTVSTKDTLGVRGCQLAFIDTITASFNEKPKALLSVDKPSKCEGDSFTFSNKSVHTDSILYTLNSIINRIDNPSVILLGVNQSGTVQFIAKNNNGCSDTFFQYVEVRAKPEADFDWDIACSRTVTNFIFKGSIPSVPVTTSFHWNFNGEDSSRLKNPSKLFATPEKKIITLTLKSSSGCQDSAIKELLVKLQSKASFSTNDVCEKDSVTFINQSENSNSFNWKFGDGQGSSTISPKHLYNIGGMTKTFNVTLVAIVPNGCSDSTVKAVTVNANPNSDFTFTTSGSQVAFTAFETNAIQYNWNFGDGGSAITSSSKANYNYIKFPSAKYTVCLKVINAANCSTETCKEISVSIGIGKVTLNTGISIYPNPSSGNFNIAIPQPIGKISITFYSILGEEMNTIDSKETNLVNVSYTDLSDGSYILKIDNGDYLSYHRLFIKK